MKLPFFTQYTDKVKGGDSFMFRVRMNPKYKDNVGLHLHEYQHIKQWYKGLAIGLCVTVPILLLGFPSLALMGLVVSLQLQGLAYTFVPYARKLMEVEAFRVQIKNSKGVPKEFFIKTLVEEYNLNITTAEARELLYGLR